LLLSNHYQGNVWWTFWGVLSLFIVIKGLLNLKRRRRLGESVDAQLIVGWVIFGLCFVGLAVFQVLSHR
jgi:hypothetical protein